MLPTPSRTDGRHAGCPVGELFAMLGQPHMLEILHLLNVRRGTPMRFNALQSELRISPKTLSVRLKSLVEAGFLTRRSFNEIPPRVEYEETPKSAELGELFVLLSAWAGRNTMSVVPTVSVVGRFSASPPAGRTSPAGIASSPRRPPTVARTSRS